MYRRKPQGWIKHIDFLLLDVGALLLSFFAACFVRYGREVFTQLPHYFGIVFFNLLAVVLLHIVNNTFSGVLRRGYYREFVYTVKHVALAELAVIAYLFVLQQSDDISRIVIGLVALFYILVGYAIRILWKRVLRSAPSCGPVRMSCWRSPWHCR